MEQLGPLRRTLIQNGKSMALTMSKLQVVENSIHVRHILFRDRIGNVKLLFFGGREIKLEEY